jgi:hypothetical protein
METKPDNVKDNTKASNPTKAPEVVFETVYVDSAPKLRNPEHLVHYELGKSGKKHGILSAILRHEGIFGLVDKKMYQHSLIITSTNLVKHFTSKPAQTTPSSTPK